MTRNEVDADMLADIETKDKLNMFQLSMADGSVFEIECRQHRGYMEKSSRKLTVYGKTDQPFHTIPQIEEKCFQQEKLLSDTQ